MMNIFSMFLGVEKLWNNWPKLVILAHIEEAPPVYLSPYWLIGGVGITVIVIQTACFGQEG